MEERLDRVGSTTVWHDLYSEASVVNLLSTSSDHSALFLGLKGLPTRRIGRKFKFEAAWLLDVNCKEMVDSSGRQSITMDFHDRNLACGNELWR